MKRKGKKELPEFADEIFEILEGSDYDIRMSFYEDGRIIVITDYESYVNDFPNFICRTVADNIDSRWGVQLVESEKIENKKSLVFSKRAEEKEEFLLYALACGIESMIATQMSEQLSGSNYEDMASSIYSVSNSDQFSNLSDLKNYMHIEDEDSNSYSAFDL